MAEFRIKAERFRDIEAKSKALRDVHVLRGADYVTPIMGGRANSRREADK